LKRQAALSLAARAGVCRYATCPALVAFAFASASFLADISVIYFTFLAFIVTDYRDTGAAAAASRAFSATPLHFSRAPPAAQCRYDTAIFRLRLHVSTEVVAFIRHCMIQNASRISIPPQISFTRPLLDIADAFLRR